MKMRRTIASGAVAGACLLAAACSGPESAVTVGELGKPAVSHVVGDERSDKKPVTPLTALSRSPSPGDPSYAWPTSKVADLVNPTGWWFEPIPEPQYRTIAEQHPDVVLVNTWHDVVTASVSRDVNGVPTLYDASEPVPINAEWPSGSVVVLDANTYEVLDSVGVYSTIDEMNKVFSRY